MAINELDALVEGSEVEPVSSGFVSGRDTDVISNVLGVDVLRSSESLPRKSRLLTDNRFWNPTDEYSAGPLLRGADSYVVPDIPPAERERVRKLKETDPFYRDNPEYWRLIRHNQARKFEAYLGSLAFNDPERVAICIKRKQRREILAAKGQLGRFHRRKYLTPFSRIKC